MNIQANVSIIIEKGERKYSFSMPVGAPFGEAYDAAFEALVKVSDMAKEAAEKAAPQQSIDPEIVNS